MNTEARSLSLQKQLQRYSPVTLEAKVLICYIFSCDFFVSYAPNKSYFAPFHKRHFETPFIYMQLTELSEADQKALGLIVKAAKIMDDIFYEQVLWSPKFLLFLTVNMKSQILN